MGEYKFLREEFRDIGTLLSVLKSRQNNEVMRSCKSSIRGGKDFTNTESWEEAIEILSNGYKDAIQNMKKNISNADKISSKYQADVMHPIPYNAVIGYIPNVANALQGIPQSMITIDRKPIKKKTIEITYVLTGSCEKDIPWFEKAGTTLLSAINFIEKNGIQTKINLVFMCTRSGNEVAFPSICIKNYGERFSLQKISFPLVHTSMFRRIGFKWLETSPQLTEQGFHSGYGTPMEQWKLEAEATRNNQEYIITPQWINDNYFDVNELLKKLEII